MKEHDYLQRFLFEHAAIRGELAHLDDSWREVLSRRDYPPLLRQFLGELMAAAALLAANLKFTGALVMQIQGTGPLRLLVVESTHDLKLRATAQWGDWPAEAKTLKDLVGEGRFVITLDPKDAKQAYQGIISVEGDSIAHILEDYLARSEQIDTKLWLAADDRQAAGMLLQKLPGGQTEDADAWNRVVHLGSTITPAELLELPAMQIIRRLYHEEDVRVFQGQPVQFFCTCNRERVANMLRMIGQDEVNGIIDERGKVDVDCEYCSQHYTFDAIDAQQLFASDIMTEAGSTRH